MVREDLVNGAVTFLQDPTVAAAPLEQRLSFLRSKNLTQEEIDLSLQRVGSENIAPAAQGQGIPPSYSYPPQAYQQGYGGYPNSYWQPPPEPPRRDWRDWFIMATVVGGVGYGAYALAKRYIYPVIAPPTPPQLEQDKASIDASFDRAFTLIEQLATDTEELKSAERVRTEKLDLALSEVEAVISNMKDTAKRREDEARRTNDEVRSLRDLIPKAIKAQEESSDARLKELAKEMQSLKTLIANRVNPNRTAAPSVSTSFDTPLSNGSSNAGISSNEVPAAATTFPPQSATQAAGQDHGLNTAQTPARSTAASPFSARSATGRAKIPAWQMAASKQNDGSAQDTSESGTAVEASS